MLPFITSIPSKSWLSICKIENFGPFGAQNYIYIKVFSKKKHKQLKKTALLYNFPRRKMASQIVSGLKTTISNLSY